MPPAMDEILELRRALSEEVPTEKSQQIIMTALNYCEKTYCKLKEINS